MRILLVEEDTNLRARVLLGVLAMLLLAGFAAGCGLLSDQTKQEAKKKVEAKAQDAKQEAKKKVEVKGKQAEQEAKKKVDTGQVDLQKKVDDLKKKEEAGQQDLKEKVDDVQKDVDDLQKKVDELLKMAHALEQQRQKQ